MAMRRFYDARAAGTHFDGSGMTTRSLDVINDLGLHARAAAKVVTLSKAYQSDISLSLDGQSVDAKSIMGLLMLAASKGTTIQASAQGNDAIEALDAMEQLFADRFGEAS